MYTYNILGNLHITDRGCRPRQLPKIALFVTVIDKHWQAAFVEIGLVAPVQLSS